jgi:hypothetical protein
MSGKGKVESEEERHGGEQRIGRVPRAPLGLRAESGTASPIQGVGNGSPGVAL